MSELAQVGVAGALAARVPHERLVLASKFFEFFQDRPTSDAVNPVISAQKLAIRLHSMEATDAEVLQVADRLDRRCTFRPTVADVVGELEAIRNEVHSREFELRYRGAKLMRSPGGEEAMVTKDRIDGLLIEGWELT